jgi:hypothetical protein
MYTRCTPTISVDVVKHRISRLRCGGRVRTNGSAGSGNGQLLNCPWGGIAMGSDGRTVVANTGNHRVKVLV